MLMRENPYDFVSKDSKGKNRVKKPPAKKPKKKGDDN
jgi:hypothetical protein